MSTLISSILEVKREGRGCEKILEMDSDLWMFVFAVVV
jgi:hypothetical protein